MRGKGIILAVLSSVTSSVAATAITMITLTVRSLYVRGSHGTEFRVMEALVTAVMYGIVPLFMYLIVSGLLAAPAWVLLNRQFGGPLVPMIVTGTVIGTAIGFGYINIIRNPSNLGPSLGMYSALGAMLFAFYHFSHVWLNRLFYGRQHVR